jgi:hypothetical protein
MTEVAEVGLSARRIYTRIGALFVAALFVGVFVGDTLISWNPLNQVYRAFQETQSMVNLMIQVFSVLVLYLNATTNLISWRTQPRTMNVRNATIIVFSLVLAGFFLSDPLMEQSPLSGSVNTVLQGACEYGLFLGRYGMMYYWVLRRFGEFRTIDRIMQLVTWFMWTIRDNPIVLSWVPFMGPIVDWVRATFYTGLLQGVLFTVACGALIIAMRVLIGREPGIIEAEVS